MAIPESLKDNFRAAQELLIEAEQNWRLYPSLETINNYRAARELSHRAFREMKNDPT